MKTVKMNGHLINYLTIDEDLRQDLWVHYLSGNPVESFSAHLEKISAEYSEEINLRHAAWQLINSPTSTEFEEFLVTLTDFEKQIVCSLMLGSTIEFIAISHGISEVRIRQTIAAIRYNPAMEIYHGIKNPTNN